MDLNFNGFEKIEILEKQGYKIKKFKIKHLDEKYKEESLFEYFQVYDKNGEKIEYYWDLCIGYPFDQVDEIFEKEFKNIILEFLKNYKTYYQIKKS